jgi:hypothetical protein
MDSIVFSPDPTPKSYDGLDGAFLGFQAKPRDRNGIPVPTWRAVRGRGPIAWGPHGRIHYEIVGGREESSKIQVTPPGAPFPIDFGPVVDTMSRLAQERTAADLASAATPEERAIVNHIKDQAASWDHLRRLGAQVDHIVASPDGRWLAANSRFLIGGGGGVLIGLESKEFRAKWYSQQLDSVLGFPIWSSDSLRLYFVGVTHKSITRAYTTPIYTIYRLHIRE